MKTALFSMLFIASLLSASAQENTAPLSSRAPLSRLAEEYRANRTLQRDIALQLALKKQWPVFRALPGGGVLRLERVDKLGLPVYTLTTNNIRSAATTGTDQLWPGGSSGLNLRGASPALRSRLAIWDGGALRATHQEFGGRIEQRDRSLPMNEHATHVAGTLIAAGINRPAKGMAFGAPNLVAYDFLDDNAEMADEAAMLLISNHSYGALAGWRFNEGQSRWEWYGASGAVQDYKFGYYDITAREWDQIAFNAPYYLIVKSAGNNRNVNGPEEGADYYRYNEDGIMAPAPAGAPFPSPNDGYDILPLYATAKNILLVGAINPIPGGYSQPSDVVMTAFSSWGPTDDGRIKPDLMGNGVGVLSTSSDADDAYTLLSGTSMASPNIAGSLLLLQELYASRHDGTFMRSATLKGLAIHTAGEAGPAPGPDYRFGWGVLDAARAAAVIANTSGTHLILEESLEQGAEDRYELIASGYAPLEVTVSWTDPEADTISEEKALDNPTPRLVNDLDVRVSSGETAEIFYPWILDPTRPDNAARKGDNVLDNVEKLIIPAPAHGETYSVSISHKGALERGPQSYSLIISGAGGKTYCTSAPVSDSGLSIESLQIGSLEYNAALECTRYTNLLNELIPVRPGASLPFSIVTGSCGSSGDRVIKLFADWNADGDFSDEAEVASVSPVLPGNSTFSGSIEVPEGLLPGNFIRLRIVAVNTAAVSEVVACGTYDQGETLDVSLEIIRPSRDVAVETLISPAGAAFCPGGKNLLSVLLRNNGTQVLENIPLTGIIQAGSSAATTLSGTFDGQLLPGDTAIYTFPWFFAAEAATAYNFTITAALTGDQAGSNNVLRVSRQSGAGGSVPDAGAFLCGEGEKVVLVTRGAETVYWYDQLQGGNFIGAGDTVSAAFTNSEATFYAAVNEFRGQIGPAAKSALPPVTEGDAYNQYTPSVVIETHVPLVIESARMYTGNPGKLAITVYDQRGTEISRSVQHVSASRSIPGPGGRPDDPSDTGKTYFLNLRIPKPGRYLVRVDYEGTAATIFRNDSNAEYPFQIPGIMSITGTTAGSASGNSYYYFYGMNIRALGCPGPRIPVRGTPLLPPGISQVGDTLFTDAGTGLQWFFNDEPLEGATGPSLHALESGTYEVAATLGSCTVRSAPYSFTTLDDLIAGLESNGLKIYPNPGPAVAADPVTVEFYAREQDNAEIRIVGMQGNLLYKGIPELQSGKNIIQLALEELPPGMYILHLLINGKSFVDKFVIHR